ncbi:MAG: NUDIX hydrolase [Magnetococcus sp. DMHC-8]
MRACPEYFYTQSAVLPVRHTRDGLELLMITSRRGKRWIIPKGVIEPHLSPAASAAKEAEEEAGVLGEVLPGPVGTFRYEKWGDTCAVQVFVMQVTRVLDSWLEEYRSRAWLSLEEAMTRIDEPELRALLHDLPAHLEKHGIP